MFLDCPADCWPFRSLCRRRRSKLYQHSHDAVPVSLTQKLKKQNNLQFFFLIRELKYGTPIFDVNNKKLGYSKEAAKSGIAQVTFSRIAMAAPGMGI